MSPFIEELQLSFKPWCYVNHDRKKARWSCPILRMNISTCLCSHQVLEELCQKNNWGQPVYQLHSAISPDQRQLFLYKITIPALATQYPNVWVVLKLLFMVQPQPRLLLYATKLHCSKALPRETFQWIDYKLTRLLFLDFCTSQEIPITDIMFLFPHMGRKTAAQSTDNLSNGRKWTSQIW